jgi:hypothetical protein
MPQRQRERLDDVADDIIEGAEAIAAFIWGRVTRNRVKRVFYLADRRLIPVGKLGRRLVASKAKLRRHFDNLTNGKE